VFLFSGCANKEEAVSNVYLNSPNSIEVNFVPGAPSEIVLEGDAFPVSVFVENKGETKIDANKLAIHLMGINPNSFEISDVASFSPVVKNSVELAPVLVGIDGAISPGGIETLSWGTFKYQVPITTDQPLNFKLKACYPYSSTALIDVCFSDNPFRQSLGTETCEVQGEKVVRNNIGPVKVVSASEFASGNNKYTFRIKIENSGFGEVYKFTKDGEECLKLTPQDINKVTLTSFKIGNQEKLEYCTLKEIYLSEGSGEFSCTVPIDSSVGQFEDTLEVKLSYGYMIESQKAVTVKNTF